MIQAATYNPTMFSNNGDSLPVLRQDFVFASVKTALFVGVASYFGVKDHKNAAIFAMCSNTAGILTSRLVNYLNKELSVQNDTKKAVRIFVGHFLPIYLGMKAANFFHARINFLSSAALSVVSGAALLAICAGAAEMGVKTHVKFNF